MLSLKMHPFRQLLFTNMFFLIWLVAHHCVVVITRWMALYLDNACIVTFEIKTRKSGA